MCYIILGFRNGIKQWIWEGINLGRIDSYVILEWANDMKLHVFATKHNKAWTFNL